VEAEISYQDRTRLQIDVKIPNRHYLYSRFLLRRWPTEGDAEPRQQLTRTR
jgi:hypothetical protein